MEPLVSQRLRNAFRAAAGMPELKPAASVLVVSHDELLHAQVQASWPQSRTSRVPHILHAMGEVAAGRQPDLLLVRSEASPSLLESAAASLRRLSPGSVLALVVQKEDLQHAEALRSSGVYDHVLLEPLEPAALASLLTEADQVPRASDSASSTSSNGQGPTQAPHRLPPRPAAPPPADSPAAVNGHIHAAIAAFDEEDLLEHLIQSAAETRASAIDLIRKRTHMAEAALASTPSDVPPGHAWSPVIHRGTSFGYLHAPSPCSAAVLQSAARQLAAWLTLDRRLRTLWDLASRDDLTHAWNRRYFSRFLKMLLDRAAVERFSVTLMVFDIDNFKSFNDRFGHAAGDEILRETAKLMQSLVREQDVVARIGGDEFAVIFWDAEAPRRPHSQHPNDVRSIAQRFQKAILNHRFPKLLEQAPATLTISGGLAGFPWDGRTPEELMLKADAMAMQSKKQGKNALTFGPGAMPPA